MRTNVNMRIDARSLILGVLIGMMGFALLGAADGDSAATKISSSLQFLVLEAIPKDNPSNPNEPLLKLQISPDYGKIDTERLKFRQRHETQELTVLVSVEKEQGKEIRRGDMLLVNLTHLTTSRGSRTVRHLPSGGSELVP